MRHPIWIWQYEQWPHFCWNNDQIIGLLASVRAKQGELLGLLCGLGFDVQVSTALEAMMNDVLRNSEIEGLQLDEQRVRSSVARHLGIDLENAHAVDHYTEGVVQVLMDAVQHATELLTEERLFAWHKALFPMGQSGLRRLRVGAWRDAVEPMQVVSGAMGHERVHYEAPASSAVADEMKRFLDWLNAPATIDPILKVAVAHLWFVNIHPFDDGNGRIARTITDMLLTRADGQTQRYYSMSAAILKNRKTYYETLEFTGKHGLDITDWIVWFLQTVQVAVDDAFEKTQRVLAKAKFWQRHADTDLNERQRKVINRLWDGFEGVLNTSKWAKMNHTSQATALRDIQELVTNGILQKSESSGRSTNYKLVEES